MGEATSLYNMIRNLGGSMGIAFAFTMATRRAQFHQARLVESLTPFDPAYLAVKAKATDLIASKGLFMSPDAPIYRELLRQSSMLGFNDAFFTVAVTLITVLGLVLIMQKPEERS